MKLEKIIAIGLCTGSILCHTNSYPDETKTLEQVEQELKENEKKIEESKKIIIHYITFKENIQDCINKKEYSKIKPEIDSMENELKESSLPITKIILEEIKNITYIETKIIPKQKTTRKIPGHYEDTKIPAKYKKVYDEEIKPVGTTVGIIGSTLATPFTILADIVCTDSQKMSHITKNVWTSGLKDFMHDSKEVKIEDEKTEKIWVNESTEEVILETFTFQLKVSPYSGKTEIINPENVKTFYYKWKDGGTTNVLIKKARDEYCSSFSYDGQGRSLPGRLEHYPAEYKIVDNPDYYEKYECNPFSWESKFVGQVPINEVEK